jgi:protein-tyrosine phosphatase
MIDIHCHILPGLDDGAQNLDDSLAIAEAACDDGIKKIVVTPHVFRDNFSLFELSRFEQKMNEVERYLERNRVDIELYPGAEVHFSHDLIEQVKRNRDNLVLNKSSYLLIEFPSDHIFSGAKNIFFELMSEGITPIIAHPERNKVFIRHTSLLYELIQQGSLAQANSGSFLGLYGLTIQRKAIEFLKLNMLHFIASDAHSANFLNRGLSKVISFVSGVIGKEGAMALVDSNPQAVLDDGILPYFSEPVDPGKIKKSIKLKVPGFFTKKMSFWTV